MSLPRLPMPVEDKPSLLASSQPASSQQQLPGDCLPCKLIGCAGFGGLGLYSYYQASQIPQNLVARRLGLVALGTDVAD
ncbi:hypothetical protein BG004_007565 [Podila humilis]|nr:hypothetical protein BG004_007565 [Podila humilis]